MHARFTIDGEVTSPVQRFRALAKRTLHVLGLRRARTQLSSEWLQSDWLGDPVAHGRTLVRVDHRYCRPNEVLSPFGDATQARQTLGWEATISLEELTAEMLQTGLLGAQRGQRCTERFQRLGDAASQTRGVGI